MQKRNAKTQRKTQCKNAMQKCNAEMLCRNAMQKCNAKMQCKNAMQKRNAKAQCKNASSKLDVSMKLQVIQSKNWAKKKPSDVDNKCNRFLALVSNFDETQFEDL
jgi:hypothetical protein